LLVEDDSLARESTATCLRNALWEQRQQYLHMRSQISLQRCACLQLIQTEFEKVGNNILRTSLHGPIQKTRRMGAMLNEFRSFARPRLLNLN
jgi:hypothetical protein